MKKYKFSKKTREKMSKRQRGEGHNNWKGGIVNINGYIFIRSIGHPAATVRGRYVKKARLIAEKALGRYLKSGEVMHHINGLSDDDRNENLLICTQGYHVGLHNKKRNYPEETKKKISNSLKEYHRKMRAEL